MTKLPFGMVAIGLIVLPSVGQAQPLITEKAPDVVLAQNANAQLKRISNSFQDTDLKQALSDLALSAGVTVVPDETVSGNVTGTIKNKTIEQALDVLLLPGGYSWIKIGEAYLVGKAEPTSPNFLRFATTRVYKPNFATAEKLVTLLPKSMDAYVKAAAGERTITVTASPSMMERIMRDIKMLDTPTKRVMLEAMVTEVATSTLNNYDLSFSWKKFGIQDSANTPSSQFQYSSVTPSDFVTLTALVNKGLATIKASPRIMTLEGKEALIDVGQENYFEVISGPVSFPVATVQLIKTGISLKITPYISDDGQITVTLNPEVSDATGSGANGLPINTVRKASTTVRVKDGETIVIGGMTFENKRRTDNKVPVLGDIPLFGSLFRFHGSQTTKQDVIIMVTPRIIKDDPMAPGADETQVPKESVVVKTDGNQGNDAGNPPTVAGSDDSGSTSPPKSDPKDKKPADSSAPAKTGTPKGTDPNGAKPLVERTSKEADRSDDSTTKGAADIEKHPVKPHASTRKAPSKPLQSKPHVAGNNAPGSNQKGVPPSKGTKKGQVGTVVTPKKTAANPKAPGKAPANSKAPGKAPASSKTPGKTSVTTIAGKGPKIQVPVTKKPGTNPKPPVKPKAIKLVSVNTASVTELAAVPGIGRINAEAIVNFRKVHGPLFSIDDLADAPGLHFDRVKAAAKFLLFGSSTDAPQTLGKSSNSDIHPSSSRFQMKSPKPKVLVGNLFGNSLALSRNSKGVSRLNSLQFVVRTRFDHERFAFTGDAFNVPRE